LLPILRKKQRKCYSTRIFGSSISVNKSDDTYTCPQGEILKPREDGTRKAVELSKAVISSIPNTCKNCPVNHLCTSRTAGREIDRNEYADAVENNKRYQENPQLYRTRQEINEHIFGTIKDNGVTITL
jgi:hypothetical protein